MTLKNWMNDLIKTFEALGIENPASEVDYLVKESLSLSQAQLITLWHKTFEPDEQMLVAIERRKRREPFQYIFGRQMFYGYTFYVNRDVLIPRNDTELLIEVSLKLIKTIESPRIVDICTGSGCIPITLKLERPDSSVVGTDISEKALAVAKRNCEVNQVVVELMQGDLLEPLIGLEGTIDLISSNPPYINSDVVDHLMPEVLSYEPRIALDGGADGMDFYNEIISKAQVYLKVGGYLVLEIGFDQWERIKELLEIFNYSEINCLKDYQGYDRIVSAKKR